MNRVVIPLDTSNESRAVFAYVKHVFHPRSWRLALLYVAPLPRGAGVLAALPISAPAPRRSREISGDVPRAGVGEIDWQCLSTRLETDSEALQQGGFTVDVDLRFNDVPLAAVAQHVHELGAAAVAAATHGATPLGRAFSGDGEASALRSLRVPIFLVQATDDDGRG